MATIAVTTLGLLCVGTGVYGSPVTLASVPAYAFNVSPAPDGQPGIIGCGPTTGAMILGTYWGLQPTPLAAAREMHSYMNISAAGFGSGTDFQFGLEQYALDQGYIVDAVLHLAHGTNTALYPVNQPDNAYWALDANFWDTSTGQWVINVSAFLNFLAVEIDAGRPVSITLDSNGDGSEDHWMPGVGYDFATGQWAGYNTWDNSLHWYDVGGMFDSDHHAFEIGWVRTFDFEGPAGGGGNGVPDPGSSLFLLSISLVVLRAWGKRRP